jgi:CubicO group peptidase (beta-lactamase class C family)
MTDTGFSVPAEKLGRLATCYASDESGDLTRFDGVEDSQWSSPPAFPDGADGLVSTVDDFLAFGRLMLDGGRSAGGRILSRPSVELMTADHLTAEQRAATGFLGENHGWGFGMSTIIRRDDIAAVPGRFGWDGGLGTSWYSDPAEGLVGILMTQRLMDERGFRLNGDFWTSAYQAIDD